MRKFLIAGALCAVTFGGTVPVATAQTAPVRAAEVAPASGYELLLEASALMQDGPNGSPSAFEALAPDENLRRQRSAVARNAGALAKLRAALRAGILAPLPRNNEDIANKFEHHQASREFARQLAQEAAVRAADGDAWGAAQSNLNALRLGAQISRGPIMSGLVGVATAAIGRKYLEGNASALDAAQSRAAARELEIIGAQMPTLAQILRYEEATDMALMREINAPLFVTIADFNDPVKRAQLEAQMQTAIKAGEITAEEAKEAREQMAIYADLTPADFEADFRAVFEQAQARAQMPYFAAAREQPIRPTIPAFIPAVQVITAPSVRFSFERDIVSNRLLIAALKLRAIKLEAGQYPATFDAGTDPFSPTLSPLIYRRVGESYLLYSVGPDGTDDGGGEIQLLVTNEETGVQSVTDRLQLESMGDVVAPVL